MKGGKLISAFIVPKPQHFHSIYWWVIIFMPIFNKFLYSLCLQGDNILTGVNFVEKYKNLVISII